MSVKTEFKLKQLHIQLKWKWIWIFVRSLNKSNRLFGVGFFFVVPFEVLVAVLVFDLFCFLLGCEKQLTWKGLAVSKIWEIYFLCRWSFLVLYIPGIQFADLVSKH